MVFGMVAIVDSIIVVVGDGGSTMSAGSKGVVGEGISVGNGEEVVEDIFVIMICERFGSCVNRVLKMSLGVLRSIGKRH